MNVATKRDLVSELAGVKTKSFSKADEVLREESISFLKQSGLPISKSEEYRFTPITRTIEKEFDSLLLDVKTALIKNIDQYLIPGLHANVLVFVNGSFVQQLSKIVSNPDHITIKPLSKALAENAKAVDTILAKKADLKKDPFSALNTAIWTEGLFVHVPENTEVAEPLFILHLNEGKASSHTRIVGLIETNSDVTLIERFESTNTEASFTTIVEEIIVKEDASLNYYKIQNDQGKAIQVCNTFIHQSDRSHVNTFTLTMNGQLIRNNLNIAIDGENCESHFHGLYILNGNTLGDNHTVVDHLKPNSFSNELYKGVMDGSSKGVFNGKIYVRPHAQKTNAFQSNRNVLLTDTATINTKPQLEIWADDVKCSHGCTSGQLDEEALFYLQSRGIGKEAARAMLLYAFALEALETIKDENLKTYFDHLIGERLHKNF
ncbi:MAG TPA: Fe-S cluster assembly protein SufD [Cyclobacteriaceae bacterium]